MISVIILTYNEEPNICQALDSVLWSDNVVVVDSFSTDATEQLCRQYCNVTFIQHTFEGLAQQRQYALSLEAVRHDWILALDADEYVPGALSEELLGIAARFSPGAPVAYDIAMRFVMWGKWLRYSSEYPVYWRRFFRRDAVVYRQRGHADTVDVIGATGRTRNDLIHQDRKGLSDWLSKHNRYTTQEAMYANGELNEVSWSSLMSGDRLLRRRALKRLFRTLPGNAFIRFVYLFVVRRGFLDGVDGYSLCRLRAHQHFIIRLKQRELRRARS